MREKESSYQREILSQRFRCSKSFLPAILEIHPKPFCASTEYTESSAKKAGKIVSHHAVSVGGFSNDQGSKGEKKTFFSLLDSPEKYESVPRSDGKQIGQPCQCALCGHSNAI